MKHNFSSAINQSLAGRIEHENPSTIKVTASVPEPEVLDSSIDEQTILNESTKSSSKTDQKGRQDKGLGKNIDGSFKQSNAGRRVMEKAKKKVQLSLTLTPTTKEVLDEWSSTKPRSTANYISEYVEEHFEEIMNYFSK